MRDSVRNTINVDSILFRTRPLLCALIKAEYLFVFGTVARGEGGKSGEEELL